MNIFGQFEESSASDRQDRKVAFIHSNWYIKITVCKNGQSLVKKYIDITDHTTFDTFAKSIFKEYGWQNWRNMRLFTD